MVFCIRLLIVLWCSAKTRKINLMVHYVLCLLRSEAEIKSFIYTTSILIISSEAVQISSDITKEELCQYIVLFVERCSTFTLMRDLPYLALFSLRAYILPT